MNTTQQINGKNVNTQTGEIEDDGSGTVTLSSGGESVTVRGSTLEKMAQQGPRIMPPPVRQPTLPRFFGGLKEQLEAVVGIVMERSGQTARRQEVVTSYSEDTTVEYITEDGIPMIGVVKVAMKAKPKPPEKN